jgi:hypothetical protein
VLFHYNGHGVPRPTVNGEIWVFNSRWGEGWSVGPGTMAVVAPGETAQGLRHQLPPASTQVTTVLSCPPRPAPAPAPPPRYTQYIPLSIFELQAWLGTPAIYVLDCSAAGLIINR